MKVEEITDSKVAKVQCPYCDDWMPRKKPLAMYYSKHEVEELISTNCSNPECGRLFYYTATAQSHKSYREQIMNAKTGEIQDVKPSESKVMR